MFFEIMAQKTSPTYVGTFLSLWKWKSILTFEKWTKKMSKIDLPKIFLLTNFFDSIVKIYGLV